MNEVTGTQTVLLHDIFHKCNFTVSIMATSFQIKFDLY